MKTKSLEELIAELPAELRERVEEYILFICERYNRTNKNKGKMKFEWENALAEVCPDISSVELQQLAFEIWGEQCS